MPRGTLITMPAATRTVTITKKRIKFSYNMRFDFKKSRTFCLYKYHLLNMTFSGSRGVYRITCFFPFTSHYLIRFSLFYIFKMFFNLTNVCIWTCFLYTFSLNRWQGQFSLVVAMFMSLSVCVSVPNNKLFIMRERFEIYGFLINTFYWYGI